MLTFILMPTFAISASLVGAAPAAYAVPLATYPRDFVVLANRGCRQVGCLVETFSSMPDSSTAMATPAAATTTGSPAATPSVDTAQESPDPLGLVVRAVGAARPYVGQLSATANEGPEPNANKI